MNRIAIITPSLVAGGSERVLSDLANYIQREKEVQVHIILLTNHKNFYSISEDIKIHYPDFDYKKFNRLEFTFKIFFFLRNTLKKIRPISALSFGGRYNSFVILSIIWLDIKIFISDRSQPGISYGRFINLINKIFYKKATGIIAQTDYARLVYKSTINHHNIKVIGNPIHLVPMRSDCRKNVVLNVGRFIESKQQELLIELFEIINNPNWQLWFLGDGPCLEICKRKVSESHLRDNIVFFGNQRDVWNYYFKSKIFAFTSISEGFPNALGEGMAAGCACISFNCVAGPSELIEDKVNGFLVKENDLNDYIFKLNLLMSNEKLIREFGVKANERMLEFESDKICAKYYEFISSS